VTDELTPEQEADVRRLLAEARHDEPIPADVAARLDAVLGDLSADDLEVFEVATVTDLAGVRHRRRNAGRLLLAAAAVVVGGIAAGQVVGDGMGADSDDASTAADAGGEQEVPREASPESAASGGDTGSAYDDAEEGEAGAPGDASADQLSDQRLYAQFDAPYSFSTRNFPGEVASSLKDVTAARSAAAARDLNGLSLYSTDPLYTCADIDYGRGAKLPAFYDEQEAVLVLRRPEAGVQRVELLACGTAERLDAVDLPAP
jgi:hypothetical protein